MNEEIKENIQTLAPFTKLCMTIGQLPASYTESMSYYEQLIWFTKYLQEQVIPAVNQNAAAVTELQNYYIELQNYVNHYFDNLNIQEEVNKKLDEMAEDGTLTNLIKIYVDSVYEPYETDINLIINNQNDNINDFKETINNQINIINSEITGIASGSPAGVYANISDLTTADPNHNKIYVVTADGKWYYYNSTTSSWTAGGTYQTTSNQDQVDEIEDKVEEIINNNVTFNKKYMIGDIGYTDNKYLKNGEEKANEDYLIVDYTPVIQGATIYVEYVDYNSGNRQICMYDKNKNYIGNATITIEETYITNTLFTVSFTCPDNCYFIRYSEKKTLNGTLMLNGEYFDINDVNVHYSYSKQLYEEPYNKIPLFVFTFDRSGDNVFTDTYNTGATIDEIMTEEYGFKYTVATQVNSEGNLILSSANAKILENQGCDLCIYSSYQNPYTVHNNDPNVYTDNTYSSEWKAHFQYAINKLNSIGVYNPTAWCSRWNKYGSAMKQPLIDCGFLICRGNNVNNPGNSLTDKEVTDFNEFDLDIRTGTITSANVTSFLGVIDECIINKKDFIITTHELRATDEDATTNYTMTPSKLRLLCSYLKNLQDAKLCRIVTMREYAELRMKNRGYDNNYERLMNKINNL